MIGERYRGKLLFVLVLLVLLVVLLVVVVTVVVVVVLVVLVVGSILWSIDRGFFWFVVGL